MSKRLLIFLFLIVAGIPAVAQALHSPIMMRALSYPRHSNISNCDITSEDSLYLYRTAKGLSLIDPRHALDTMRMYVDQHPYATKLPGQLQAAVGSTVGLTNRLPNLRLADWITNYDWLVQVQTRNDERAYQDAVIRELAFTLMNIDYNEAANMFYNYTLLFPDSMDAAYAWQEIHNIRNYQSYIPEDTTPFHIIHFPLEPKAGGAGVSANSIEAGFNLSILANPAREETDLQFSAPIHCQCRITLFDVLGRQVQNVFAGMVDAGVHTVQLNLKSVSTGSYYIRLEYPGGVLTRKLVRE